MEKIEEYHEILDKIMTMLENHFPNSEIVLHDFSMPYEHTIVDIRNNYITGRKIGGCLSNYGLDALAGPVEGIDKYCYITHLPSASIMRSSSMYFTNAAGKPIGSLCINTDITEECRYADYLQRKNHLPAVPSKENSSPEVFVDTVQELLEHLIEEAQGAIGKAPEEFTRADKIHFLGYLDKRGALLISKSGERLCAYLGISKFTLYKYLEEFRNSESDDSTDNKS